MVLGTSKVVKTIEEIEVKGTKTIDTKSSTSKQTITAQSIKDLPVDNLSQAVAVKAGVVAQGGELHFRGGRGGEVKYQFDGVEVSDPLFGRWREHREPGRGRCRACSRAAWTRSTGTRCRAWWP